MNLNSWTLRAGLNALNPDNYLSFETIDNPEFENGDELVDMTSFSPLNPEQVLLRKERWMALREETKQVINLIVNCPTEIMADIIGTRKRSRRIKLNPKNISRYLQKQWGEKIIVDIVMKEIREFIRG